MSARQSTVMTEAFAKAGVSDPEERLKDIALSAMVSNANDTMAAVEAVWEKVQKDNSLLIALFNKYGQYRSEIGRIFHQLKTDIAIQNQRGQALDIRQKKALKIVNFEREQQRKEDEDQRRIDREEQARKDHEYAEYLASWHKTPLFGITIGDRPVWESSAGTIRAWLPTQRKKLRALEMLIDGVPDDGRPLEYYVTPDDVKKVWKIIGGED